MAGDGHSTMGILPMASENQTPVRIAYAIGGDMHTGEAMAGDGHGTLFIVPVQGLPRSLPERFSRVNLSARTGLP